MTCTRRAPVAYDVTDKDREAFYFSIFRQLLDLKLVEETNLTDLTKGESPAWPGAPIPMQISRSPAGRPPPAMQASFGAADRYIATEELMAAVNAAMTL